MQTADLGLGTTFERFAIYEWLASVADGYPIHVALEGPGDGVAGIPGVHSIPLAQKGCEVTVVLEDPVEVALARQTWSAQDCLAQGQFACLQGLSLPFPSRHFDLVWNFNRLPFLDPTALVAEMVRLSRRYVALVVPNRRNYGFPARRLYHLRTGLPWTYGDMAVMTPSAVHKLLRRAGLRILETRWLDVPWWPDIIDPVEWLVAMIPGADKLLARRQQGGDRRNGYRWEPENLPYFDPVAHAGVHQRMRRLGWMERTWPPLFQTPFAHHFAVLAVREDADA
ncbi:MAG: class I SAM-dependent methyltransferase [Chloroflexi bacterium]|nr:class I SAM-dependent methyltransferase [Chloroflexota bacterium]